MLFVLEQDFNFDLSNGVVDISAAISSIIVIHDFYVDWSFFFNWLWLLFLFSFFAFCLLLLYNNWSNRFGFLDSSSSDLKVVSSRLSVFTLFVSGLDDKFYWVTNRNIV